LVVSFGTPGGFHIGQQFESREEIRNLGLHTQNQAGISGNGAEGCDAIVLSGGYKEDRDYGDYILYSGHGGQDANRHQTENQNPTARGNAALITSFALGLPVRVIRGSNWKSPFSPRVGYRYAGLYVVTQYWQAPDANGYAIMRYRLDRIAEQEPLVTNVPPIPDPAYATSTVTRRIRDTALSRALKTLYLNRCQICQTSIPGIGARLYSEGAHVRPLGKPHLGEDVASNLLCLCPNHHTQFDIGGMIIFNDFSVAASLHSPPFGSLTFHKSHALDIGNVEYHRDLWSSPKASTESTSLG
jgi:putative restriction endonuclease